MVRSVGKLAAPLVCALLAQQQALASARHSLAWVLKNLKGEKFVHCGDVCQAEGQSYRGFSSSWRGEDSQTTCKCSSKTLEINCKVVAPSYTFSKCCAEGKGCHEDLGPDPAEEALEDIVDDLPEDSDIDLEDVSEEGVPDCGACPGASAQLTKSEIAGVLTLHNKMRKAVGTPPLKWNCDLMCQVQKHADTCTYSHSDSYGSSIKAGENMASGTDGEFATWMWFSEYGKVPPTEHASPVHGASHFSAIVWKATKELGCGVCKSGKGYFWCQYANSQPNWNNAYAANVPKFHGTAAQYKKAGLDMDTAQKIFKQLDGWGIHIGNALTRFFSNDDISVSDRLRGSWAPAASSSAALGIAGAVVAGAAAVAFMGLAAMRLLGRAPDFCIMRLSQAIAPEDESCLESSLGEQ